MAVRRLRQVQVVDDEKVPVAQHGQVDFGARDVGSIAVDDRRQRVGDALPAPDALVNFELDLSTVLPDDDRPRVRRAGRAQ
ncbi:MAG: hypothetical protein JOZ87_34810 [Chloroflexi bacterium]|nr:hypothetical protein [Chloroflexota bacterium]